MDQHLTGIRDYSMKKIRIALGFAVALTLLQAGGFAQDAPPSQAPAQPTHPAVHSHRPAVREQDEASPELCAICIKSNLEYLAGPELRGRGSTTEDEHHAAEFIAGKLKSYGLEPAAEGAKYVQMGTLKTREVRGKPTLTVAAPGGTPLVLTHGQKIVMSGLSQAAITASLLKVDSTDEASPAKDVPAGAAVVVKLKQGISMDEARKILGPYRSGTAAIVIVSSSEYAQRMFAMLAKEPPSTPQVIGDEAPKPRAMLVLAKQDAFEKLWAEPDGATVKLQADLTPWQTTNTWNVLAKIEGTNEKDQIILLSAHLDHLGVEGGKTYPGADDDASGTAAVLELARVLAKEPKLQRTIVVALWGSEERGSIGASYFLQKPTFPLKDIVANLEFEMIGRADAKVKPDELWLTGWERTNLGPELAQHGAKLVGDPHPDQKFFMRSDNYALASRGIVAQTVSSFGLHKDYHQPTDTVDKIDFTHMDQAIASMIGPVTWLANTEFKPEWVEGQKP
jgi:hypothetical protein